MASRQLGTLYRELQCAFGARPTDLKKCDALLAQLKVRCVFSLFVRRHRPNSLKIGLIQTGLLIPTAEAGLQDLAVARTYPVPSPSVMPHISTQATSSRSVLSAVYGPKTSPRLTDIFRSYRRSIPTLGRVLLCLRRRCLSLILYRSVLPPSKREFPVRGLNLIRLLTQNRIADFHTTLESLPLPADEIGANPYIAHPVNLERWLMEGSYSKVWNAREEAPAEEYKFFVDSLMGTIRFVADDYRVCRRSRM